MNGKAAKSSIDTVTPCYCGGDVGASEEAGSVGDWVICLGGGPAAGEFFASCLSDVFVFVIAGTVME